MQMLKLENTTDSFRKTTVQVLCDTCSAKFVVDKYQAFWRIRHRGMEWKRNEKI
jgi:hypothetical protein